MDTFPTGLSPATTTDTHWLWALAPDIDEPPTWGKWLWFLPMATLDTGWRLIHDAVLARQLGPVAKAGTLINAARGDETRRVICIYTTDLRERTANKAEAERVLLALRDLGVPHWLAYKRNDTTDAGVYGDGAAAYVSPTATAKMIDRSAPRSAARRKKARRLR
ncbi:putative phosphothreonine lyase domain-containg protein [Streptomyces sp. NPDC057545]|uniref:putative phosphothreonine lyase domain-containing protein n=1 Tax=Streptomyces sp. NPDC057545 TaxID=3346164 RepID=UPI0036921B39